MKFFPELAVLFLFAAFGISQINAGCVDEDHIYECHAPDEEAEDITCTECYRDGEDGHYNCSCWTTPQNEEDETVYRTCQDAYMQGETENGTYTLKPDNLPSFKVYCDMDRGGWTVIQRRMNGSVDFYQGWAEYIHGFGDVDGDYWLGLSKIHRLISNSSMQHQLRVDLESYSLGSRYALYNSFSIDGPSTDYTLRLSGYSGNAGNSMSYNNGRKFSTKDNDNDASSGNCASSQHSGWWHGSCTNVNLNGRYYTWSAYSSSANYWLNFDSRRSLKYSSMMIRVNND